MARQQSVERPLRKSEYELMFASSHAQKGWRDLKATMRNSLVNSWEFLTKNPLELTESNYPLKGDLDRVVFQGESFERWQHKPSLRDGARIWFFVDQKKQKVYLEKVFTSHPNQTK